jgi:uncharacterized membrane protein YkoI
MKRRYIWTTVLLAAMVASGGILLLTSYGASAGRSGALDDGKELLPRAGITIDEAIATAQTAASGQIDEIDLEYYQGRLVFNVDVGNTDVKVDASNGTVVTVEVDD